MKFCCLVFILLCSNFLTAQTLNGPESVDFDTLTNTWYVGNTGSGKIMKRTATGTWANFINNISAGPYGIEVVNDRIYACSGAKVRGFNLSDGSPVFTVTTGATFLNGLTHDDNGNLYATDFSGKKIYKINVASASAWVYASTPSVTPNGIIFDKNENRLVFVTWGSNAKIMGVSMADSTLTTLKSTNFSNIDGIAMDGLGRFYVAHWGGSAVHRYEHDFVQAPTSVVSGLNQPADIYYNLKSDTLAIPNAGNNTVKFVNLAPVSSISLVEKSQISIQISPNPANEFLILETIIPTDDNVEILQVTNNIGQKMQCPIEQIGKNWMVRVQHLPIGIYNLTLRLGKQIETYSFVR
jgi:hypothetical protein